jgi:hypothetical protein
MTPAGWVTMIGSVGLVWGLMIWSFYKVLTARPEDPEPDDGSSS